MKIAQIAPLFESVPPKSYGGTERVVSYLTEELVRMGHDVTLFASGDSVTNAELAAPCPEALRLNSKCVDQLAYHIIELEMVARRASEFDLIHFHIDYLHYPLSGRLTTPHLTTLHGRLDIPDLNPLYQIFGEQPLISISDSQRDPLPEVQWVGTVHHGLPEDLYSFHSAPGDYLAFIGRISPEKRPDRAIRAAKTVEKKLKIAAKVDKADEVYFEEQIKPLLDDPLVEYVGEIGDAEKNDFLGRAEALLFPIDWPEPFGLVMIESLACGTPVVAYRNGSVPEVLTDGVSGVLVDRFDELPDAIRRAAMLDRKRCRQEFVERFSVTRMAENYLKLYTEVIKTHGAQSHELTHA